MQSFPVFLLLNIRIYTHKKKYKTKNKLEYNNKVNSLKEYYKIMKEWATYPYFIM